MGGRRQRGRRRRLTRDRVFVGNNDFNQPAPETATVDLSLNAATAAGTGRLRARTRSRTARRPRQDGPPIRIAAARRRHGVRRVRALDERPSSVAQLQHRRRRHPRRQLGRGRDAVPGARRRGGQTIARERASSRFNATMGQERLGADLAIAVDPNNSGTVWIAWCDRVGGVNGHRLDDARAAARPTTAPRGPATSARSPTRRTPASRSTRTASSGCSTRRSPASRWVTTLELTSNGWSTAATTVVLHTAPSTSPARSFFPYIGDYVRMLALGTTSTACSAATTRRTWRTSRAASRTSATPTGRRSTLLSTDGVTHGRGVDRPVLLPLVAAAASDHRAGPHPISTVEPITRDPITTKPQPISIVDPPPLIGPVPSPVTRGKPTRRGKGSTIDL